MNLIHLYFLQYLFCLFAVIVGALWCECWHVTTVESVRYKIKYTWETLNGEIDKERFEHVRKQLKMQLTNARQRWNICLAYLGRFAEKEEKSES